VQSVRGVAGGMSVIADKFTANIETSPANSKVLKSNLLFVNLKLITHCIQRLCYNRTSLSDILVFRNVSDVCTHLLLEMGDAQTEKVLAVVTECSVVLYK
jgi:hypothetical protein